MVSINVCFLLNNKTISKVADSERYSNKETIQNKNKARTKTHNSVKGKRKRKEQRLSQHEITTIQIKKSSAQEGSDPHVPLLKYVVIF